MTHLIACANGTFRLSENRLATMCAEGAWKRLQYLGNEDQVFIVMNPMDWFALDVGEADQFHWSVSLLLDVKNDFNQRTSTA